MKRSTIIMGIQDSKRFCRGIRYRREKEDAGPLVDKMNK